MLNDKSRDFENLKERYIKNEKEGNIKRGKD